MNRRESRISLRPIELEDAESLVSWRNQPEVWAQFFNIFPLSRAKQQQWFQSYLQKTDQQLFIIQDENGRPIGTVGLNDIDFKNQRAEFGRLLIGPRECSGKGYAKEATLQVLDFGFKQLNLNRIYLYVFADNKPAIHLYEACGFIKEGLFRAHHFSGGRWRDVLVMSILRNEYLAKQGEWV